ncbi:hypothetical protein BDW22DRAFT_627156 [Trametopsis cervina]|nr:hypothetical protein BDW22DRAFT_627156 [Trametopsis cervina]
MAQYVLVPQQSYQAPRAFQRHNSILFTAQGAPGINLRYACDGALELLDEQEVQPTLSNTSARITLRILWPGYPMWTFTNLAITDHTYVATNLNMRQIAHNVARCIQRFFQDMAGVGGEQPQWITDIIDFDRLYLTELIHVSQGSWQPILYYLL